MSKHVTISPDEAADRLAIRELVEAYANFADRRDAKGQMSLFTPDTHFVVYMNAKDPTPSQELHSREALAPVFAELNKYDATTHFVGQSTIFSLTADRATGEAYCLAHHVTVDGTKRRLMVAALRYLDMFVKMDSSWLTVPGVGPVVALTYRATVFGLTPSKYQSGEINRTGAISKCGDEMIRVMLYEAAQIMLVRTAKWSWLKAWAMKIARHRGMKKAIVALARRLAVIMHRIWVGGTEVRWTREAAAA